MTKSEHDKLIDNLRASLADNIGARLTSELASGIAVVFASKLEGMVEVTEDDISSSQ
jgi:hypothetical protein